MEVFTHDEIARAHMQFYTVLFSEEPIDPVCKQQCLDSFERFLPDLDQKFCDEPISLVELTNSVKTLNQGKSPGPDGLTVELYLHFWSLLEPLLLSVSEECLADGYLSESMKGTATRLIYKKHGDIKNLKNLRPISLLNIDYKIISKVITLRLSRVLHNIVHPERSIFSNLFLIRDILDYIEQTGETAILLSLDQQKAFYRVNRTFLMDLLHHLGFGPIFCKWIQTFYSGAYMRIILNGHLTDKIFLQHGVRQGNPLSPLLYVICVEALANLIRCASNINGYLLPGAKGRCAKTRLYADDTTVLLKNFSSLVSLFSTIAIYEASSGAKLNKSQTEAMWLGAWKNHSDTPLRSLSLIGKSIVVNVLGISNLLYLAKVLIIPPWVIPHVNQTIWPFLWGSRMETVSCATCFLKPAFCGIGVCNLLLKADALMLGSLVMIINSDEDRSFFLCKYFVGRRLSTSGPHWKYLRDNSSPSAALPTPFDASCLKTLALLEETTALTSKKIYETLLVRTSSPPILSRWWVPFLSVGFFLSDHWFVCPR